MGVAEHLVVPVHVASREGSRSSCFHVEWRRVTQRVAAHIISHCVTSYCLKGPLVRSCACFVLSGWAEGLCEMHSCRFVSCATCLVVWGSRKYYSNPSTYLVLSGVRGCASFALRTRATQSSNMGFDTVETRTKNHAMFCAITLHNSCCLTSRVIGVRLAHSVRSVL